MARPKFIEYLRWAEAFAGCRISTAIRVETADGTMLPVTCITTPAGRQAYEVGILPNDVLAPTTIWRLDRRLGLTSPFQTWPADTDRRDRTT
jgi:hypothetical protein